jgi:hypothetical protein
MSDDEFCSQSHTDGRGSEETADTYSTDRRGSGMTDGQSRKIGLKIVHRTMDGHKESDCG